MAGFDFYIWQMESKEAIRLCAYVHSRLLSYSPRSFPMEKRKEGNSQYYASGITWRFLLVVIASVEERTASMLQCHLGSPEVRHDQDLTRSVGGCLVYVTFVWCGFPKATRAFSCLSACLPVCRSEKATMDQEVN
ncbi:uncharacterized protein MCYG_01064 [Microsporum canis CBS 113480]|uniref:Uncharacterized protein n=1 Tax=Arthroderma otae (strain ATCC MYA-4605 / CBS 113480) TaxID=554155 RepID=C5FEE2_ARTOC|nr:uncharacterized protein MCYG_01064 [Microsporum canis CBS 113480]EEQ28176.1 predicted protein [Microsporum canis CBS 113480]